MLWSRAARLAVMVSASACLGLGFGLNYGKSNQSLYLLDSVRKLHPELWTRDWLAHTQHYHPLYEKLGTLMLRLDPTGWAIALANVAAVGVGLWCVYRLLRSLLDEPEAFVGFMLVLTLAAACSTDGVGGSYVFSDIFQPSTLGSVGLLGASLAFVSGRCLLAGLCLAFAGAFHLNYLLLGLCVFGVAWLASGKEQRFRRGLWLLGPSLPVLLWFLPILMASSGTGGPAVAEEARRLFQDVRAPHHYRVASFVVEFLPWLGFQLLGVAALWSAAKRGAAVERRLLGLLLGFIALISCAALLSSVVLVRAVDQLFAWRVSPHANLLAQVALVVFMIRAFGDATFSARRLSGSELVLGALGASCLALAAVLGTSREAALVGLGIVLLLLLGPRLRRLPGVTIPPSARLQCLIFGLLCALVFGASLGKVLHLGRRSDLLSGRDADVDALCGWLAKSTPKDALLLTPPSEEDIRFRCQRAIVVDWKSNPAMPDEVIAWAKRIEDVTGRHPLQREADLSGYESLDAARLEHLRARYGFDTLVLHRGSSLALALEPGQPPDFSRGRFLAYRLH
ncbi:MAG TPA: DUF6798 domain-containing protein [Polyangiaceae bacterium]|nr:DUF6798 domain-containing protein [Polyangiaceae bacterium]